MVSIALESQIGNTVLHANIGFSRTLFQTVFLYLEAIVPARG
jgi:hypothetical protein